MSSRNTAGIIQLSDGTILKLVINIIDARESGFSPFGGINIIVKPVGGVATSEVAKDVAELIKDKPVVIGGQTPQDGWELIEIAKSEVASAETTIKTTKGEFLVKATALANMAARNLNYQNQLKEPVYALSWVPSVSWKPMV